MKAAGFFASVFIATCFALPETAQTPQSDPSATPDTPNASSGTSVRKRGMKVRKGQSRDDVCNQLDSNREIAMGVVPKAQFLADQHGWSLRCAEGFIDGEIARRRAKTPPQSVNIGIDDYSRGFRAGYYGRTDPYAVRGQGKMTAQHTA